MFYVGFLQKKFLTQKTSKQMKEKKKEKKYLNQVAKKKGKKMEQI